MTKITKEQRIEETLKKFQKAKDDDIGNTEYIHIEFDRIICDLLINLGYTKVVDAYKETDKWYA